MKAGNVWVGKSSCVLILIAPLSIVASSRFPQASESVQRIQKLIQEGNTAAARQLLSESLLKSPRDPNLYNLDGVVRAQAHDFTGSEASFQKAIELAPSFEDAYLNLGHLYQEWMPQEPAARDKAIKVYAQIVRLDPGNSEANYQSALLLMQKGLYTLSLQHLAKLPAKAQDRSQALSVQCGDEAGVGNAAKAEGVADRMLQTPDLAEADVVTILPALARRKDTKLAIELLEGLNSRNLATANSLADLGLLYKQQGRLDIARKVLDQAAEQPPSSIALLLDLAEVADEQKDYTGALGYLAHAREIEPQNASIHFFWGMVSVQLNLEEEAYQALKKAVALDPNNAYYNYALGAVALQREESSEAITYFQKYCRLKPHDPRGLLALGSAYFTSHDDDQAAKVLAPIADNPEVAAGARYYLGKIANQKGNFPEAVAQLQMALKAYPNYADAYAEKGLVHLKLKDYPDARSDLLRALAINPDSFTANMNLLMLYERTKDPKADEQAKRFEQVRQERAQRAKEFLRTIEVRH